MMSFASPFLPESVPETALRWFLRLREPTCSAEDRRTFEQWLAADPTHREEYAVVTATWNHLSVAATELTPALEQASTLREVSEARCSSRPRRWTQWAAAVAMVVVVAGSAWWWTELRVTTSDYRTARGEQRAVMLADGTVMELNADSAVTVRFWGRRRQVIVASGEAYFTVAPDPARSFEVVASDGHIHDIGTQFSVYRQPERVVVEVQSGAVRIDLRGDGADNEHVVRPGERAIYTSSGQWGRLDPVEPNQIAAWREGKLRFDGISLAEAIAEVERYRQGRILLADPALGETRIRGVFTTRNVDEFFTALPTILPVTVTHRSGDVIISRR